jgi:glucosamine--fructose-6-phosphate aminotransferase (isomerizing)
MAQRGSGQAIFLGLADDHYITASEVYGVIEETFDYLKLDGEKVVQGREGMTQGQIFIADQESSGGMEGIRAMYYDGTPIEFTRSDVKQTAITSRDIDRQNFPHYFLKEISESPGSVEKTMQNRWRISDPAQDLYQVTLDEKVVPQSLKQALTEDRIQRVFFVGQGTAGVAAQACADIFEYYMNQPSLKIGALKASELSGFKLCQDECGMSDTLVVAITQSGTTTDTNRTVDMVRERGAHTLAIVNRRDSHITFKVDGVMYTSSGRDIEMSVASTKAFYSQIVAGALLGLYLARLKGRRDDAFVTAEIRQLLAIPDHMRKVLSMRSQIENSARRIAVSRTYWAVVGSGPNKTAADEVRIKLSELCYKTISTDYVEDKKHIDLSSEPLIIVCAAGTRETVLGDIIKDTAIFRAHKALPVIITDEGETRFDLYGEDVFRVPRVSEHLAPILNTLIGHVWGYYAALAINEGSGFLFAFREEVRKIVEGYAAKGMDVYELILEKSFREKIATFYNIFRKKRMEKSLPAVMGLNTSSDLTLLLKYLAGRLPVADFEIDFEIKGTARNMLDMLFRCLGQAINNMARPVDAIKHQAKTVTVGTSRISEKMEGVLFDALTAHNFKISQLTASNVLVLKNLQKIVSRILGATIYRIKDLNILGEPTDETTIEIISRDGTSQDIPSRVDKDNHLKGSKRIIIQSGNVYIGKGRKDDRSILCIPLTSALLTGATMAEHLILFHIAFKTDVPLSDKIKALGGKYDKIKNIVQESSIPWEDSHLERVEIQELFGISAEKIAEFLVSRLK